MRERPRHQRERERDRQRRGRGEDRERRHLDPADRHLLVRERQGDEPEDVDGPDEDHQRGAVRKPACDRMRREPLLGDRYLRDLVDRLSERLAPVRLASDLDPHEHDPDETRAERSEQEVGDRLVDRHVDRPDVNRDPRVQVPLLGDECALVLFLVGRREGDRGQHEREAEQEHASRFMIGSPSRSTS